jgi:hypothetical protein
MKLSYTSLYMEVKGASNMSPLMCEDLAPSVRFFPASHPNGLPVVRKSFSVSATMWAAMPEPKEWPHTTI